MERIKNAVLSRRGTVAVILSGALTALISLVMNLVLIPKIEESTNGIRCFDMNFAYSFETAKEFLALFDYCENVCTIIMLKADELSKALATAAGIFTSAKTILMYCVFLEILICLIFWIKARKATP